MLLVGEGAREYWVLRECWMSSSVMGVKAGLRKWLDFVIDCFSCRCDMGLY